jgi:signal peptidase
MEVRETMKILGKVLGLITLICYLLILAILFVAAPMVAGYKPVVVLTGSMAPTYPVGSVIYYKATPYSAIAVGDVVTFQIGDDAHTVVTHRVAAKDDAAQTLTTKGDANATPDSTPTAFNSVKGVAMAYHVPFAGFFIQYVQNFYVIGGIFLVLVAKMAFDKYSDSTNEKKQQEAHQT